MCGDGGFTMTMMEMATIAKYKLPVKVFIIKNNTLGQIKWEQMVFEGNPEFGVRPAADRLRQVRRGRAASPGFTLERPRTPTASSARRSASPGPALVQCVVDPNEPPMPGHATTKQAIKFRRGARPRREGPLGHHQDRDQEQDPRGRLTRGRRSPLSATPRRRNVPPRQEADVHRPRRRARTRASATCCWSSSAGPTANWPRPCSITSRGSTPTTRPARTCSSTSASRS